MPDADMLYRASGSPSLPYVVDLLHTIAPSDFQL